MSDVSVVIPTLGRPSLTELLLCLGAPRVELLIVVGAEREAHGLQVLKFADLATGTASS